MKKREREDREKKQRRKVKQRRTTRNKPTKNRSGGEVLASHHTFVVVQTR
jgi:hypothetical protein